MKQKIMAFGVVCSGLLASCGQQPGTPEITQPQPVPATTTVAGFQGRPELQDAGTQTILKLYSDNPELLKTLQTAYGERAPEALEVNIPAIGGLNIESDRLAYVKSVGWGSVANYNGLYDLYSVKGGPYDNLDWNRDGCSTPPGLGLGYSKDFNPACNVHDFGYRNLKVFERTDENRETTDKAFRRNMNAICAARTVFKRPACFIAAFVYYEGVRVGGRSHF